MILDIGFEKRKGFIFVCFKYFLCYFGGWAIWETFLCVFLFFFVKDMWINTTAEFYAYLAIYQTEATKRQEPISRRKACYWIHGNHSQSFHFYFCKHVHSS